MKYKLLRFSLLSMLVMFFGGLAFADQVTMKYSGTETSNMTGENDAALFGLDADAWSVVGDKGANSNRPGLNKAGDFRLYWSANGGNTITVQSLNQETINSIAITFTGANYSNVSVTVDGNAVTGTDGVFDINSTSFVLGNANTSNTRVRISEIVITYGEAGQEDNRLATTLTLGEHQTTGVVNESMDCPTVTVTDADGAPIQYDYIDWTSSDETVAGIADGNIGFLKAGTTTITAKFPGDNNYKPSSASFTLTVTAAPYTSIAAMLADITSTRTTATYQFENLLVTYVNGSNTYVSDGRNGFLFYGSDLDLMEGYTYSGTATGQLYTYNGLPEMAVSANGISAQMTSEGNLIAWPTIPAADLQSYINIPITIENAVFVEASGKNLTFQVGDVTLAVYNNWSIDVAALEADKTYTLKGVGSVYAKGETTTYQLYLVSFEEKAEEAWAWADIFADFTNQSFFTENDANGATAGLKMEPTGGFSRVAADDVTANAVISGKYHSNEHGISNFSATVKVEGPVKISFGTCAWGGNVTVKDESGAEVVPAFNTNTGACYHNNKTDNIVSAYYKGEATTLTIAGGSYVPYFAVEAVDPADIPNDAKVTFETTGVACEGVAPAEITVEVGTKITIPANTSLYAEGKTLTAWADATGLSYKAGEEVTVNEDITLIPVFTDNTVSFADRTEEVTATWDFQQKNGAVAQGIERGTGIVVTQIAIGNEVIDFPLNIDATAGKYNNRSWQDWAQINGGTLLKLPACKGTVYSTFSMGDNSETTFNDAKGTYADNVNTYTYEGSSDEMTINIQGGSYYRWVKAVYPVPSQDEPGEEPGEESVIFSWEGNAEGAIVTGGTVTAVDADGADVTADDVNTTNSSFNVIRVRGAKDYSTFVVNIALDKALKAGDKIAITAFRNKNVAEKQSGALLKFENGETTVSTATDGGLEFVNINEAVAGTAEYGTEPNTITLTVPEDADGSTTIAMTRAVTATNLFVTKIEITGERSGDEPIDEPTEFVFRDFQMDLRDANGGILTADEASNSQTVRFGITVDENNAVTRVEADAENTAAVITGVTGNNHGLQRFSATVPVEGPVQITMSTCSWGGDVTVKNAEGETMATFTTKKGEGGTGCYQGNGLKDENIVSAKYVGEATTLTIEGGAYVGFFAVQAVEASSVTIAYSLGDVECKGDILPTGGTYAKGDEYTIPAQNFTLYKDGYTLTGWTDGNNTYDAGATITLASDLNLTPVFTRNRVNLSDRTEPVTLNFSFRRDQGAPIVQWQNTNGHVWVTQAEVNGTTIDVPMTIDTNPGKFNNSNNADCAQTNNGTVFTVPSCKGAEVTLECHGSFSISTTTIDGQTDYEGSGTTTIKQTIASSAETVEIVIGDGSYYRYVKVVLPVVESQGGKTYTDEVATIEWPMDEPVNYSKNSVAPEDAFTTVAVDLGAVRLMDQNGNENATGTSNVSSGVTFSQMRPTNDGNDFVTWVVKPAAGLTFTPTKVTAYIVRFGTDSKSGVTFSAKAGEGDAVTLGTYTAPRNNKSQADDKYGSESDYAVNGYVEIELTEAQQAALTSGEGFSLMGTIGVGNGKAGGIAKVSMSGLVNGTKADVELFTLATVAAPEEAGSINVYPKADQYEAGSDVKLTATENFGYDFVNWTDQNGEVVSEEPVFTYTMNSDATLTANFVQVETYELALTVDGTNDYMVTINPAPTVIDGKNMYEAGQAVQLTANQYEGLVTFTNWSDGETNSSKLIKMAEDINITAYYAEADIIAGWDFYKAGSSGRKADFYAQDNDADALNLVNTETGDVSGWLDKSTLGGGGYESFAGAAVNWRTGLSNGDVGNWHWQTKVNAGAFENINVQFQMLYNYNAYQTYDAEYSLDGESWTKFGSITMTGTKQAVQFKENLPAEANNQTELYIRMLADKTSAVDGAASANDGNTLAMFFITGTPKLVDDGTAPVLVSTVPENGAVGASASGKIVLTFDERVKLADTFMPTATLGNLTLTPAVSGKTVTFEYKGLEYGIEYTFNLPGGSIADLTNNFVADPITLTFTTMERPSVEKGLYDYVVENVDDLMAAIAAAQSRNDKNVRYRIFIKNGEYTIPLSSTMKTVNGYEVPECITFINTDNVSFIGESRDGVIITNGIDKNETFASTYGTTSKYDGIGNSDVFQLRGQGYYWQDLTVETGMDDATGRDLAIHDRGTMNIYKNVGLRGYQDTWTSNNDNGLYYFEDGYVRGRTDYMCGKGDIFWNRVELRQIAGGYAAVPSKPAKYGWIYKDCVINGEGAFVDAAQQTWRSAESVDGNYTLGRPWGSGTPIALFIDTKMNVVPSAIGWNEMSSGWPARFAEYNSMTSTGSVIDLSGRKKTFGDGHENNPVLTAEEALENSDLHRMFGDWDPTLATEQAPVPANVKQNGNNLVWDNSNYALLWAIVKDGAVIDFTTEAKYALQSDGEYAVRAANEMGGLSEASATVTASGVTTGITEVENAEPVFNGEIYNVQGIRVDKARKGLYIINGRKVVVK
ncbi:MAG: Ig-like domain-containing protein [Prevotella sp.]|nr:Ig-like domain-containing protein [Prevotella sp.]